VTCPRCGGPAKRETDTLDTFVDSSWYFLRYTSPQNEREAFSSAAVERWLPVDIYSGGIEHAILHLLYARFFIKALFDLGMVSFSEPFVRLLNQGMVLYEGEAMSKSRGNLVELGPTIDDWGADAARVTVMFAGPPQDDLDWATVSMAGAHKWLGRVWRVVHEVASLGTLEGSASGSVAADDVRAAAHRAAKQITGQFERFAFNVAISKMMVLASGIQDAVGAGAPPAAVREATEMLVRLIAPIAPHIAEELWRETLGHSESVVRAGWPVWDESLAEVGEVVLVAQVDGRVRDRITVLADATEDHCRDAALASERVQRFLAGREIDRIVVRPPKLVNIVTRDA
jgi:leucyl-tRNA synthetase